MSVREQWEKNRTMLFPFQHTRDSNMCFPLNRMRGDSRSTFTPQRVDRDILTAIDELTTVRMVASHVTRLSKERLKKRKEPSSV
jgi:hypothetical protein